MGKWAEALEPRRLMDAGDLDTTLGDGGFVDFGGRSDAAVVTFDLKVGPHGDLIMAGMITSSKDPAVEELEVEVFRVHHDGSLMIRFGDSGRVRLPLADPLDTSVTVTARATPDGGALVQAGFRIWKLRRDGKIDRTFGHRGRAAFDE